MKPHYAAAFFSKKPQADVEKSWNRKNQKCLFQADEKK